MPNYRIDEVGLRFLKDLEGCRLTAYRCIAGKWSIGYGHTAGVREGDEITQAHADELLDMDLEPVLSCISRYVEIPLNQHELNALIAFAYNVGVGSFRVSTLLAVLNRGDKKECAREFSKWCFVTDPKSRMKVVSPGLTRRRNRERIMFEQGVFT